MKRQIYTKEGAQPSGSYSQAIQVGDFVFVSGQGPTDPGTGETAGSTVEEQTLRTLENVRAILDAAGASPADVVKVTAHIADMGLFDRYDRAYSEFFPDPKPARTTVGSALDGILVEIDVIAYVPRRKDE